MRFFLALLGTFLLFFYGQPAFADSQGFGEGAILVAYAVYCDQGVSREEFVNDLVAVEDVDDDVIILTENGYQKLQNKLSDSYMDHCGPGIKVSLGE